MYQRRRGRNLGPGVNMRFLTTTNRRPARARSIRAQIMNAPDAPQPGSRGGGVLKEIEESFVFLAPPPQRIDSMRCRFGMVRAMEDLSCMGLPAALPALEKKSNELRFGMPSERLVGALLRMLAASKPGGRILELGTGTGIATTWLLDGMDHKSLLVSVDKDTGVQRIAAELLGHDKRLTLITEDGAAFLRRQPARCFDLVFADAIPGKYEALDEALATVKAGGFYVIDDMLPQANWPAGHAEKVPILLHRLASQPDFSILPLNWASGVLIAVRNR